MPKLKLRPIFIFESHLQTIAPNLVMRNFETLKTKNYGCFCFEIGKSHTLQTALEFHTQLIKKPPKTPVEEALQKHYRMKKQILLEIQNHKLNCAGIDIEEAEKQKMFTKELEAAQKQAPKKVFSSNEAFQNYQEALFVEIMRKISKPRHLTMAKEIIKLIKQYNGGVVIFLGLEHIGVFELIQELFPDILETFMNFYCHVEELDKKFNAPLTSETERLCKKYPLMDIEIKQGLHLGNANRIFTTAIAIQQMTFKKAPANSDYWKTMGFFVLSAATLIAAKFFHDYTSTSENNETTLSP